MKVCYETSLKNFEFWGPAKDHADLLDRWELDEIESAFFDDEITYSETDINDFVGFRDDEIAQYLGYEDWDELFESRTREPIECPSGDAECPYYKNGFCTIGNPSEECDEYAYFMGEE